MTSILEQRNAERQAKENGYSLSWLEQLRSRRTENEAVLDSPVDIAQLTKEVIPDELDVSPNLTGRPRGSIARPGIAQVGAYNFRTKSEVWAYNLTKLYEEAVTRQWSSATDIPWESMSPLPDDIEAAECQLSTFFAEVEFQATDIPGRFISLMSPDYFEVRMFLLTQVMDESRHLDVFRKRALANGGGLMRRADNVTGVVGGTNDNAREFTELSSRLHVVGEGNVLTMFRMGELMAYNEAEKAIYRRVAQDEARHVAFGVLHLRYLNEVSPERREEVHSYLDESEERAATGAGGDNPAAVSVLPAETLSVLLGGGKDKYDEGQNILMAVRQKQVKEYFQRLKSSGFDDRIESGRVNPALVAAYKAL